MNKLVVFLIAITTFGCYSTFSAQEQNCEFSRKEYLTQNPDVAKANMDPWTHFTVFGKKEGRKWAKCDGDNNSNLMVDNSNSNLVKSNNSLSNKADLKVNSPLLVFKRNTTSAYFISHEKDVINIVQRKKILEEQIKTNELKLNQYFNLESGKIDHNDLNFKIEYFRNLRNADVYFIDKKSLVLKLLKLSLRQGYDIKYFDSCVISKNNMDYYTYTIFSKYQAEIGSKHWDRILVGYWQKNLVEKESNEKVVKLLVKNNISILDEKSKMAKIKLVTGLDDEYFVLTEAIKKDQTELDNLIQTSYQLIEGGYTYYGNFAPQGIRQFGVLLNSNNDTLFIGNWTNNLPDISNGKLYLYNNTDNTIINSNGSVFKTYKCGDVYIGQIEEGIRRGSGSYVWAVGDTYTGEWENGKRNGRGVYQFSSGAKYEGDFKESKHNGMDKLTYANGRIEDGLFEYNKFIKSKETIEQDRIALNKSEETIRIFNKNIESIPTFKSSLKNVTTTQGSLLDVLKTIENEGLSHYNIPVLMQIRKTINSVSPNYGSNTDVAKYFKDIDDSIGTYINSKSIDFEESKPGE